MIDTPEYSELQSRLANGWNTWNTRSAMCWVKLPSCIALNLGLKSYANGQHLREILAGREEVTLGGHAYDGSYSDLTLTHACTTVRIRTAVADGDLTVLVEPNCEAIRKSLLIAEMGILWNKPGYVKADNDSLYASTPQSEVHCFPVGVQKTDPNIVAMTPYLALELSGTVGLSTGRPRSLDEIRNIVAEREAEHQKRKESYGKLSELYDAIQTCTAWDTIYEPIEGRVITPVSRVWNSGARGGYVLFDWDTFFAGVLASLDNPDLAHANVIEILRERTPQGFVPNGSQATGRKSFDRSQPPVGAFSILQVYNKFERKWLLKQTFEPLLEWNRWWSKARQSQGCLCWGSNPFEPVIGTPPEYRQPNTRKGAALESGLDNSPMYDDIPFDSEKTHLLQLADVGLMSLYIADCRALAEIAQKLGHEKEMSELTGRAEKMTTALQSLWSEKDGLFLNKRLDTGQFEHRLSPTHFYPLLAQAATQEQAERMINEHFFNPEEFWGDWILPSIARNDPAYPEQNYWRGRIWAPMNWLVYLGLRNYQLEKAQTELVKKSAQLLLKEWRQYRHIHENYNADTGEGCDKTNSDRFYHWGGLLGLMAMIEENS